MAGNDRTVYKQSGGNWANKRNDADKASSVHKTQGAAEKAAKEMLHNQGGGEVTIQGVNGKFINKDTVAPGKDLFPPKG